MECKRGEISKVAKSAQKMRVEGMRVTGQADAHSRGIGKKSAEEVCGRGILMA